MATCSSWRLCQHDERAGAAVLLYLSAPAYVVRESGALLILGIAPDDTSVLPEEAASELQYANHARFLPPGSNEKYASALGELGLLEIPGKVWLKLPTKESAAAHFEGHLRETPQHAGRW